MWLVGSLLVRSLLQLLLLSGQRWGKPLSGTDCWVPLFPAGIANNLKHLLPLVSVADSDNYSTTKRVRHLNDLAKVTAPS